MQVTTKCILIWLHNVYVNKVYLSGYFINHGKKRIKTFVNTEHIILGFDMKIVLSLWLAGYISLTYAKTSGSDIDVL